MTSIEEAVSINKNLVEDIKEAHDWSKGFPDEKNIEPLERYFEKSGKSVEEHKKVIDDWEEHWYGLIEYFEKFRTLSELELGDVLTDEFMQENTEFDSFEEYIENWPERNIIQKILKTGTTRDEYTRKHTKYDTFTEMETQAIAKYIEENFEDGV